MKWYERWRNGEINNLFDELRELCLHPTSNPDIELFDFMLWAMRPVEVNASLFVEIAQSVTFNAFDTLGEKPSKSEIIRLVKSNALKWNGVKITDPNISVDWLLTKGRQWGIIQHGKKIFRPVIKHEDNHEN
jgi:hypothetical protein